MYFTGFVIAISTFLVIGMFHPIVIKVEYYYGTRPWWILLLFGLGIVITALFIENVVVSSILGVVGASCLWSIGELFSQKKRVEKGWFPMNPKRKKDYQPIDKDETLCPVRHGKCIYTQQKDED